MPVPELWTQGELKSQSTSSEVAEAIKASWATKLSSFADQGSMTKPEADKFAAALVHYAGSYAIASADRVFGDTVGTADESEPWKHGFKISGENHDKGTVELFVEKGSKADYATVSFEPTEGPDKAAYPITLKEFVTTTEPTDDPDRWRDAVILSTARTRLAAADIYVPGE